MMPTAKGWDVQEGQSKVQLKQGSKKDEQLETTSFEDTQILTQLP